MPLVFSTFSLSSSLCVNILSYYGIGVSVKHVDRAIRRFQDTNQISLPYFPFWTCDPTPSFLKVEGPTPYIDLAFCELCDFGLPVMGIICKLD